MAISLADLKGLEVSSPSELDEASADTDVSAILKVTPGYVPEGVEVRARIDSNLLTVSATLGELQRLENDPDVVSISQARPLHLID